MPEAGRPGVEGILVVDKASGPTSHDVVSRVRRVLGVRRVGHCGTLDPLASGVLVICVGRFTRLAEWLSRGSKEYEATFCLGARSDTDDAQGRVQEVVGLVEPPTLEAVEALLPAFTGWLEQVPPIHSAVKVDGERSYRRARRDEVVTLSPRSVRVDRFEVVAYAFPRLQVRVECGRGTYIRSLARDLGRQLGCGAYVEQLRRTRVGCLHADEGLDSETLEAAAVTASFVEPRRALSGILPPIWVDPEAERGFVHGNPVEVGGEAARGTGEYAVYAGESLLGVGRLAHGVLQPAKVLGFVSTAV